MHHGHTLVVSLILFGATAGCAEDANDRNVDGIVRLDGKPLTIRYSSVCPRGGPGRNG